MRWIQLHTINVQFGRIEDGRKILIKISDIDRVIEKSYGCDILLTRGLEVLTVKDSFQYIFANINSN